MLGLFLKNRATPEERARTRLFARFRTESDVYGIESADEKLVVCPALFRHPLPEVAEAAVSVFSDPSARAAKASKILAELSEIPLSDDFPYSIKAKAARALLEQLHASARFITDGPTLSTATRAFVVALETVRGTFAGSQGEDVHYLLPVLYDAVRRDMAGLLLNIATAFGLSNRLIEALGAIAEDKLTDGSTRYNAVVLLAGLSDLRCVPVLRRVSETKVVSVGENAKAELARLGSTVRTFHDEASTTSGYQGNSSVKAAVRSLWPDETSVLFL